MQVMECAISPSDELLLSAPEGEKHNTGPWTYLHLLTGKLQLKELPMPYSKAKVRVCLLASCFPL